VLRSSNDAEYAGATIVRSATLNNIVIQSCFAPSMLGRIAGGKIPPGGHLMGFTSPID
jgi:hypothetical protein